MLLILFSVGKNLANPSKPFFKPCNSMKSLFTMVIAIFPSAVQTGWLQENDCYPFSRQNGPILFFSLEEKQHNLV